jgi:hypothetical protein
MWAKKEKMAKPLQYPESIVNISALIFRGKSVL